MSGRPYNPARKYRPLSADRGLAVRLMEGKPPRARGGLNNYELEYLRWLGQKHLGEQLDEQQSEE